MGIIEDALADFAANHFEEEFEEVEELKDELRDLQSNVADLQEKVDQLIDQKQKVQKTQKEEDQTTDEKEETTGKRVSSRTLKSIRKRFDLTQQELSDLLDVSSVTIGSWERGDTKPQKSNKEKIVELREKSKKEVEGMLDRDEGTEDSVDVRSIRKEHGLTQKEFAEQLDVSPTTVYNWEKGNSQPSSEKLEQIRDLEVSGDEESGSGGSFSGEDLKELRDEKDLSQADLAEKLDVSAGTISNWERGNGRPSESAVEKLRDL